jgi:hypothetical protein
VSKLERSAPTKPPAQASSDFRLEELIANQPVAFEIKVVRTIPNQEIDLLVQPPPEPLESYISNANFKLFSDGDYTRLAFTSQTDYFTLSDRIFEPVLTYATRRKMRDDLARLKVMVEAEGASPAENRKGTRGQ